MPQTVKLATARELAAAGSIRDTLLVGQRGGYAVLLKLGGGERALATRDGSLRLFSGLDAAARVLRDLGIDRYQVDATGLAEDDPVRRKRPDRAAALKEVHQAAAHDEWFRSQVLQARREADDPDTPWVPHDQARDDARRWRRDMLARAAADKASKN
ncbi:MAG: hypothetical protein QM581_03220 [Pseudomonas sp.]